MSKQKPVPIIDILKEARFYPSPHNSQPMLVKVNEDETLDVYYDLKRGLPAEAFGAQFGYVCTGVFLKSLEIVARHYGYKTVEKLILTDMDFTSDDRHHLMGSVSFVPAEASDQSEAAYKNYLARKTSRIPYDNKLVDASAIAAATALAATYGQTLHVVDNKELVKKVIDINQRTLFMDLENDAVHAELMEWLRFSHREAETKADGLSAETMLINGSVLRFMIKHRGLWRLPIIGSLVKYIYLNTMRGVRQVGWISGPFATLDDYVQAGKCFMDVWVLLTGSDIRLHPYGTVITNQTSHKAFTELVGQAESDGEMAWILFRLGYSKLPPQSFRRDLSSMIIEE